MKLHATRIPSPSIVGVSISIQAWKNGPNIAVLALFDVRNDDGKSPQGPDGILNRAAELAEAIVGRINGQAEATDSSVLQNDLRDMLRALGKDDGARPQSPHQVFRECIDHVERLKAETDRMKGETS